MAQRAGAPLGAIIAMGVAFIAFATYGVGLEASFWCLVLLAGGLTIRTVMRRVNSRATKSPAKAVPA